MAREWRRLEGTPQRELFRELRERFLARHAVTGSHWAADMGAGPARFSGWVGTESGRTVLVDLSVEMLREARLRLNRSSPGGARFDFVRADAVSPPLRWRSMGEVVAMGNVLGFAGTAGERLLEACAHLVAPDGLLVVEAVAGPGEVSAYLSRLPEGAVRRLLAAPVRAVRPRVLREGFRPIRPRRPDSGRFRRWAPAELENRLTRLGFRLLESVAVAPALGADPRRISAVRAGGQAWRHLLELEEALGREPERVARAASYLVAARRTREIRAETNARRPTP